MNIRSALLDKHSKPQSVAIAEYIGKNPKRFAELVGFLFIEDPIIPQRVAWAMSCCVEKYPELITPYIEPLIVHLCKDNVHDGVIRNSLQFLQSIPIPTPLHGTLMNLCFDFVQSKTTPVAIKAYSLTILHNLSVDYPDIIPEIILIINDNIEHETAAFTSRARKVLQQLQ